MTVVHLDPGLYTNVFHVDVPSDPVAVLVAQSSACPNLRELRIEIKAKGWDVRVYRARDKIFAYGPRKDVLKDVLVEKPFQEQSILLHHEPEFCARCILEGLGDQLKGKGYREYHAKGRVTYYESQPYGITSEGNLRIYRGYDLRTIFWKEGEKLLFGLIVDIRWQIQDATGRRLGPAEIAQHGAMRECAQLQEEILHTGQINTEVSRLRLQQHILPFVDQHKSFPLPCGGMASIDTIPMRVILGG